MSARAQESADIGAEIRRNIAAIEDGDPLGVALANTGKFEDRAFDLVHSPGLALHSLELDVIVGFYLSHLRGHVAHQNGIAGAGVHNE